MYCFGGAQVKGQTVGDYDNVVNMLDLTNKSGTAPADLMNQWNTVSPDTTAATLESRMAPQAVAFDDYRFVINGGFSTSQLVNQTVVYNAINNKYYAHQRYTEPPYGARQM